jgi:O-antigen ligase
MVALLIALWVAGGASRADVPAQILARGAAIAALLLITLFGAAPAFKTARAASFFVTGALLLVIMQLIPLPFDVWRSLPLRQSLTLIVASDRPWLPLTIAPSATRNALASLLVPAAFLVVMTSMSIRERRILVPVLIAMIFCAGIFGLFQFSVGYFDNPLFNDTPWQVNGPFANRNHFALFMSFGCLLMPAWAFSDGRKLTPWSALSAVLVIFFFMMVLVSGSRAGLLVCVLALGLGIMLVQQTIRRQLHHAPRWALPALLAGAVGVITIVVLISVQAGRAISITRIFAAEGGEDMRSRALPTVLSMISDYFPAGSGFGGFDIVFRMHEPFALLKPTYFNHAHNDFLEIVLDGGLPGLLLLAAGLGWWAWASTKAWRGQQIMAKLGSAMLLLVFVASAFDYPARTPTIMAMIVIAAVWLGRGEEAGASALPRTGQPI